MREAQKHSPDSLKMLDRFGRDGMSSDESSTDEDGGKQYRIQVRPWRSTAAGAWLRRFDVIDGRGRPARHRIVLTKASLIQPVKGLPLAAYDNRWLAASSDHTKEQLRIDDEEYDFWTFD